MRKLHRLAESKNRMAGSRKLRALRWVHLEEHQVVGSLRPTSLAELRTNKYSSSDKGGYSMLLRMNTVAPSKARANPRGNEGGSLLMGGQGGMGGMHADDNEARKAGFVADEWELRFEAGCRFYLNVVTGECREALPVLQRRDPPKRPMSAPPRSASTKAIPIEVSEPVMVWVEVEEPALVKEEVGYGVGVGAMVYDPQELDELLAYLEQRDKEDEARAKAKAEKRGKGRVKH